MLNVSGHLDIDVLQNALRAEPVFLNRMMSTEPPPRAVSNVIRTSAFLDCSLHVPASVWRSQLMTNTQEENSSPLTVTAIALQVELLQAGRASASMPSFRRERFSP
jgi:hypothetical protein